MEATQLHVFESLKCLKQSSGQRDSPTSSNSELHCCSGLVCTIIVLLVRHGCKVIAVASVPQQFHWGCLLCVLLHLVQDLRGLVQVTTFDTGIKHASIGHLSGKEQQRK